MTTIKKWANQHCVDSPIFLLRSGYPRYFGSQLLSLTRKHVICLCEERSNLTCYVTQSCHFDGGEILASNSVKRSQSLSSFSRRFLVPRNDKMPKNLSGLTRYYPCKEQSHLPDPTLRLIGVRLLRSSQGLARINIKKAF